MKTILLVLALTSVAAYADEASKKAKVEAYWKAAGLEEAFNQNMSRVRNQFKSRIFQQMAGQLPSAEQSKVTDFQDKLMGFLVQTLSWETFKPDFTTIYSETFTEKELDDFIAFYNSPSGKVMVSKNPIVTLIISEETQKRLALVMPKLQEMIKASVEASTPKS